MRLFQIILVCTQTCMLAIAGGCSTKTIKPEVSAVEKKETLPFVGDYRAHRWTLPNGLKLVVVEDHSSPTFAYQTWFRVGSRDEDVGHTGLAHLFEHMMFKETRTLKDGEFDRILEGAGAEGENAFTNRDYTAYVQELPKDKLDLIAGLESERMVNLVVNEKAFKTETEVVQNERRFRNENSPDGLMYQEIFGLAFTRHAYRWPVIGYQEDLERMSGADAVAFYKNWYSPNHATVIVIGDVNPGEVHETVKKHYSTHAAQPDPVSTVVPEPAQTAPRRKVLKLNMQIEKLMTGYHVPEITHADNAALAVARSVLAGGKSSRLHRALVETGIASSVDVYDLDDKDPSLFIIAANLQKKKKAAEAEAVILREIARLEKEPVPAKELERAKNGLSFQFYDSLDGNSEKARFIGQYETVAGGFEKGTEIFKKILNVTPEQVQTAIQTWLKPSNRSVIVGVPK